MPDIFISCGGESIPCQGMSARFRSPRLGGVAGPENSRRSKEILFGFRRSQAAQLQHGRGEQDDPAERPGGSRSATLPVIAFTLAR